ncbi:MAG TPA: VWA domain-containing protein [Pyrinomonadaceae bacterium]
MSRRKKNSQVFAVTFLLVSIFLSSSPALLSQEQQSPSPPAQRMRRVKGQQPRTPTTPSAATQAQSSSSTDDDVVRVDTDLATILLTAIDKERRFITTLKKEDVRVTEDNTPQEISVFERETDLPLTLAILIDTSRSEERVLPDEKIAAHAFVDSVLRAGRDQVSIVTFTGEATLEQPLTGDLQKLRAAIERVTIGVPPENPDCEGNVSIEREPRCYTGVWDAVWVTINEVLAQTPEHTRRAIILLTDGTDTSSTTKRQEAIDFAVKNNVVIYSIGIGDPEEYEIADDALRKVSEKTGGRVFFPENKPALDSAFTQIQQELRSQYFIAYQPSNRARDGSLRQVRIEIINPELRKQKLRLLYRQGYYAKKG